MTKIILTEPNKIVENWWNTTASCTSRVATAKD